VPASVILMVQGNLGAGIGLFAFCALVVGSIDNLLRPVLVGKDTNMHELMIFFGTLGGLFMFGMSGLLIGPLIASLFLTIWQIYGVAFKDILPPVGPMTVDPATQTPPRSELPPSEDGILLQDNLDETPSAGNTEP
jgi:hypothetical protein